MPPELDDESRARVNAKDFQEPLISLAETMAQKVNREGHEHLSAPKFVAEDIFMMMRQSMATYQMLFYLNADERREKDVAWNVSYGVVAMQIIRSMIDCFYNITAILENPREKGIAYRLSGFRKALADIGEDEVEYGGTEKWDYFLRKRRELLDTYIRMSGLSESDISTAATWQTLGRYLGSQPETPYSAFLKKFTYMQWRQYSSLSHGTFDAYIGETTIGAFFISDLLPHEKRPMVEANYEKFFSMHLGRAATVLLCLVTELQAYFRFYGANINDRIMRMWEVLRPLFEAKELYKHRYCALLKEKGIAPKENG